MKYGVAAFRALSLWLAAQGNKPAAVGRIAFEDATAKAGIHFKLLNGATGSFSQPEIMLGGLAALDYNNDGCTDIFATNGATLPDLKKDGSKYWNRLYRNNCDGTFTDVTEKVRGRRGVFHGSSRRRLRQQRVCRSVRHGAAKKHSLPQSGRWHF